MSAAAVAVEWEPMPAEVQAALAPHVYALLPLAPTWLHRVTIGYNRDDADAASSLARPEYRRMRLDACADFLNATEERRAAIVLHEIVHAHVEPLRDAVFTVLNAVQPDPATRRMAEEHMRLALEGTVTDLTRAFLRAPDQEGA